MSKVTKEKDEKKHNYVVVTSISPTMQKLLQNDSSLTEIRFLGFGLTIADVQHLSYALTENKVLKILSLDHLGLKDDGAAQLSQGLCYNESLTSLSMRWNKIGNKGALSIANCLHYNQCLTELLLAFNDIGDPGAKAFALAMKRNSTLESLDLKWNKIGDQCGEYLLDSMADNRTLINLYLGGNGTTLRNVGKRVAKKQNSRIKSKIFSMRHGSSSSTDQNATRTVTLDQLRKDTAARSASEVALAQANSQSNMVQQLPTEIQVGDTVQVKGQEMKNGQVRQGKVAYVGETQFASGTWCGVVFDSPVGKNDGSVNDVRYFECEPNHGSFLRPEKLIIVT